MEVYSLSSYINILSYEDFIKLATEIYNITDFISKDYSDYKKWYFNKQIPRVITGDGEVFFIRDDDNKIIAITSLKRCYDERKICTLYVASEYRCHGLATLLLTSAMEFLGTTKPVITLAGYKLPMFKPLFDKYGWKLTQVIKHPDDNKRDEMCFNGNLLEDGSKKVKEKIKK